MKRFTFLVVDDQITEPENYERFINLLKFKKYMNNKGVKISTEDSTTLGWNLDQNQTLHFQIMTSDMFTFCTALECFMQTKDLFDFFVFDLRFYNNKMDPTYVQSNGNRTNQCPEASLYKNSDLQPDQSNESNKSRYIAGLSFLLKTEVDEHPKFIYSAASETQSFRYSINLFKTRLRDIFVIDVDPLNYTDNQNDALKKGLEALDNYLKSRQTVVCQKLSVKQLQELKAIVNSWKNGNCSCCNGELILDNPNEPASDKWSLRTLFPKQVNSIEENIDAEIHKRHILDVLETDWRRLMCSYNNSNGILNHPCSLTNGDFKNCSNTAEILDFQVEGKAAQYKRLTDMPQFDKNDKNNTGNLRDRITSNNDKYKINYLPGNNLNSVMEYFASLNLCNAMSVNNWALKLTGFCVNYGIYPIDIAYISHIAYHNSRHANNNQPCFKFENGEGAEKISFIWDYGTNDYNTEKDEVLQKCADVNDDIQILKDEGLSDICKIVCWRYRGEFELCLGKIGYLFVRDLRNSCYYKNEYSAELDKINVKSVIKILKLTYNGNNQTIRYKVTISKPVDI